MMKRVDKTKTKNMRPKLRPRGLESTSSLHIS